MLSIPWRQILRIFTHVLLILAVILFLITLLLWYLNDTGRLSMSGFEPLNVFIATIISGLLGLLGRLADKRFTQPPDLPPATIDIHDNAGPGMVVGGGKVRAKSIAGRDIHQDNVAGDKIIAEQVNITHSPLLPRSPAFPPLQRPPRADHFTGRQDELKHLLADIRPGHVTTLCGPGGIGKTALAIEALWTLAPGDQPPEQFPDGIIFHSFYNQPKIASALDQICLSFGIKELQSNPSSIVRSLLNNHRCLIMLDGAENADDLSALLDCRGLAAIILTTQRHQDAASTWLDVHPLKPQGAHELLQSLAGAVAQNDAAVDRICQFVGYLPLALRLAGHYMAHHGQNATTYLAWLQETPLAALDHGTRQHDSVPLLLKRSYEALPKEGQDVFALAGLLALAPFSIEPIAAGLHTDTIKAARHLGHLVNYGLILANPQTNVFQLSHPLIHTFSRLQLDPPQGALSHLVDYYRDLVHEQSKLGPPGFDRLDTSRIHFLAVLSRCRDQKDWENALSLASEISWFEGYMDLQGLTTDRIDALEIGLTAARALNKHFLIGAHLTHLGNAHLSASQVKDAIDYFQQAIAVSRQIGFRKGVALNFGNLGSAYHALGNMKKAISYHLRSLALARKAGDRKGEAGQLDELGVIYREKGQTDKAIKCHQKALTFFQSTGDSKNEATALNNLGLAYINQDGQTKNAIKFFQQSLIISQNIGYREGEANALGNLGTAYTNRNQIKIAVKFHQRALTIHREIGYQRSEAVGLGNLGSSHHILGEVEVAIDYFQQSLAISQKIGYREGEANALFNLGTTFQELDQREKAIDLLKQALLIYEAIESPSAKQVRTLLDETNAS